LATRGAEALDEKIKNLSDESWRDNANFGSAKIFGELNGNALAEILRRNFRAVFFKNVVEIADGKLTLTVSAPDEESLYRAFGLTVKYRNRCTEPWLLFANYKNLLFELPAQTPD
jgi:hypothetical protein